MKTTVKVIGSLLGTLLLAGLLRAPLESCGRWILASYPWLAMKLYPYSPDTIAGAQRMWMHACRYTLAAAVLVWALVWTLKLRRHPPSASA